MVLMDEYIDVVEDATDFYLRYLREYEGRMTLWEYYLKRTDNLEVELRIV